MNKLEYIVKQLSKTDKKNYENYVVTRIWNKLDNLDYKFITQQYVIRDEGNYALTDMYFPQLGIYIEVDEGYHKGNLDKDKVRENDIISATGHTIMRVDMTKDIYEINHTIDEIVKSINVKRQEIGDKFKIWDSCKRSFFSDIY